MTSNSIDKYGLQLRLATKKEIGALAEFLAKQNWEDSQKYQTLPITEETEKEAFNFIKIEKDIILELIGGSVMVQEYKKFKVSIFVYNYIQDQDKNTITSVTYRVLQTERGFEKLEYDDVVFKLNTLKNKSYHKSRKHKQGRPSGPSQESLQKTMEVNRYIKVNPTVNRTQICKDFGFSKTTYYRALKWLEHRRN